MTHQPPNRLYFSRRIYECCARGQLLVARGVFLLVLMASLFLSGCSAVNSESDVLGEYELCVPNGCRAQLDRKIVLRVSPDKSFSETISWCGRVESRSGKWFWSPGKWLWSDDVIGFDQLWIPSELAPRSIDADASALNFNGPLNYTEPRHWSMRPERHSGTVTLPIFLDADVSFMMVRPFHR